MNWTVEGGFAQPGQLHKGSMQPPLYSSAVIRMKYKAGWRQRVLLQSDLHWDNPHAKQDLIQLHLKLAGQYEAPVLMNGDVFCAMQGYGDPRSKKSDIRPEHNVDNYLNSLVYSGIDFFGPHAENIAVIGMGNHETAVLKRKEQNLTTGLVEGLRVYHGSPALAAGYKGWVIFRFEREGSSGGRKSVKLAFHHGAGGGKVSKGVNHTMYRAAQYPDADIIWTGHTHHAWAVPHYSTRITSHGRPYKAKQWHIQTPSYKEEWISQEYGFSVERDHHARPLGAYWLEFSCLDGETISIKPIDELDG